MTTYCYLDDGREEDRRIHEYDDVEEVDDGDMIDRRTFDSQVAEANRQLQRQQFQDMQTAMIQYQAMMQFQQQQQQQQLSPPPMSPFGF